jgi:hypothetical protein
MLFRGIPHTATVKVEKQTETLELAKAFKFEQPKVEEVHIDEVVEPIVDEMVETVSVPELVDEKPVVEKRKGRPRKSTSKSSKQKDGEE